MKLTNFVSVESSSIHRAHEFELKAFSLVSPHRGSRNSGKITTRCHRLHFFSLSPCSLPSYQVCSCGPLWLPWNPVCSLEKNSNSENNSGERSYCRRRKERESASWQNWKVNASQFPRLLLVILFSKTVTFGGSLTFWATARTTLRGCLSPSWKGRGD